ncbi:MAG: flippase [Phycisphaeraceae bacterium]
MPIKLNKVRIDLLLATGSDFCQKLVGYVVLMVLARYLDKATMGDFFFATAAALILARFAELGTNRYLMREVAEQPEHSRARLGEVLALRVPLLVVAFIALNGLIAVLSPDILSIVALTSCYVFLNELFYPFAAFFVGHRRVGLRAATALSGQALMIGLVLLAVSQGWGVHAILACYIIANVVLVGTAYVVVLSMFGTIHWHWAFDGLWRVLKVSLPLFVLALLGLLHFKIDTIMLEFIATGVDNTPSEEVARYEAAYKIFEVSQVLARPLAMIFLPICSGLVVQAAWPRLRAQVRKLALLAATAGGAMALGVITLAPWIIPFMFGDQYLDSVTVLRVLYLGVPSLYLVFVGTFLCNALRLERRAIIAMILCLVCNAALNAMSIPAYGAVGAAWVTLATESLLAALLWGVLIQRLRELPAEGGEPTAPQSPPVGAAGAAGAAGGAAS